MNINFCHFLGIMAFRRFILKFSEELKSTFSSQTFLCMSNFLSLIFSFLFNVLLLLFILHCFTSCVELFPWHLFLSFKPFLTNLSYSNDFFRVMFPCLIFTVSSANGFQFYAIVHPQIPDYFYPFLGEKVVRRNLAYLQR